MTYKPSFLHYQPDFICKLYPGHSFFSSHPGFLSVLHAPWARLVFPLPRSAHPSEICTTHSVTPLGLCSNVNFPMRPSIISLLKTAHCPLLLIHFITLLWFIFLHRTYHHLKYYIFYLVSLSSVFYSTL